MFVNSVKLVNFKSFGDYKQNEVIIEPKVTAIIGKNESGKSNVLDGLSRINFQTRNTDAFNINIVNRECADENAIKYIVTLKPSEDDRAVGICADSQVEIVKDSYSLTGGALQYYLDKIHPEVEQILDFLGPMKSNIFQLRDTPWSNYQLYYKELGRTEAIDVPIRTQAFPFIFRYADKLEEEKRKKLKALVESANKKWLDLIKRFPVFFLRKADTNLHSLYKYEDIEKELTGTTKYPNSLLTNLVKVIGVSNEEFAFASRSGTSSKQETSRRKISKLIDQKINAGFQNFYLGEKISLGIAFNAGVVTFGVQSNDGAYLRLSERSSGLRWYLDTYIDALANDVVEKNVVYLFDEPGISLHVNAQKELLRLFDDLANKGNQVVYTTHLPYMLDTTENGAHRIRAVIKNNEGFSFIYKSAYDARIAPESQQDTLAPIISALGMSLTDTFGPAKDRLNIVTEGMSDYIFIDTFAKLLGLDRNKYAIIPSVGATNCVNICTILHGWGCPYKAVFDYDKEGVESGGEYMRNNMLLESGTHYCYVAEVTPEQISSKTYKTASVMIEDVVGRSEIDRFISESGNSPDLHKTLTAKLMCTAIENGSFQVSKECMDRMKALLARIVPDFSSK